jgi:hypothetical protein
VPVQWAALLALSSLISLVWGAAGLPAALLLGPMIGGIAFGVSGLHLAVPQDSYLGAQAVIGAMVSAAITPAIVATLSRDLPLFAVVMAATLLGAAALGWLMSRSGLIPGATAVYGISPGAATAMVLLGEAQGADVRMIAPTRCTETSSIAGRRRGAAPSCSSASKSPRRVASSN